MKGTNIQQKLNPLGSYLLQEYYTCSMDHSLLSRIVEGGAEDSPDFSDDSSVSTRSDSPSSSSPVASELSGDSEAKITKKFFVVNDPREIPIIMKMMEGGDETYGIITITGGRHHTPIIVKGKEAIILESLGTTKSKVGLMCAAQIAMAINQDPENQYTIYTPANNRQLDEYSCGTDSFLAMKEGLKMGDRLFTHLRGQALTDVEATKAQIFNPKERGDDAFYDKSTTVKQFPTLPPEIAKYSQSMTATRAAGHAEFGKAHKWRTTVLARGADPKMVDAPAFRDLPAERVTLRPTATIEMNGTVEMRRRKHAHIT